MPPIANDTQSFAVDQPVGSADLLAHQLAGEEGKAVLSAYLAAKRADIETLSGLERELDPEQRSGNTRVTLHVDLSPGEDPHDLGFFRAQLSAGEKGDAIDHGAEQEVEPNPLVAQMVDHLAKGHELLWYYPLREPFYRLKDRAADARQEDPELVPARARSLGHLRKFAAKDAINAKALFEVVRALGQRKVPIRCEVIEDGTPRRHRWNAASRRFVLAPPGNDGLSFFLLGPSRSLVRKHRDKLPVLESSKVALAFRGEIRSITPSNQLSYIGCFKADGQSILISGDADCVDFANGPGSYHQQLLDVMKPLHVVQVAHHGGNNAHFYRVLAAAGFPQQDERSYLLLSHATHDKTRPSDVFREFLLTTLREGDDVQLLFTSEPTPDKVQDYLHAIHPRVGAAGREGDVQLRYDQSGWHVTAHSVAVS